MKKKLPFKQWLMAGAMCLLGTSSLFAQQAPDYEFQCKTRNATTNACTVSFENAAAANVHGVAVGRQGKVWYVQYTRGILVRNPDGTKHELTSNKLDFFTVGGVPDKSRIDSIHYPGLTKPDAAVNLRGIGTAHDGNILVVVNHTILYKLDAVTGEPLARWVSPTTMSSPSSTADGYVYVGGVSANNNYILKESTTTAGTYVVEANNFELPNRGAAVSRTATISPDGTAIYVSLENTNVRRYTRGAGDAWNVWTEQANMVHGATTKVAYALSGDRVFTLSEPNGATPATLKLTDFTTPANSYELALPDVTSADLRGLAFTDGLDTMYIASHATGRIFTYIENVPVIPPRTIGEILPTYKRVCIETDPGTGECINYFPTNISRAEQLQAVAVDNQSKVWVAIYNDGLVVRNPDGTRAQLTSTNLSYAAVPTGDQSVITQIRFNGFTDAADRVRSVARAHDGNILTIVGDKILYKLNAVTGEPMARWTAEGLPSLATVSSSADGLIFLHSVLGSDNAHYTLRQSTTDPTTFEVVQNRFELPNRVGWSSRSSSISPEGTTVLVSSETKTVNVYDKDENGNWVEGEDIITLANSKKAFAVDKLRVITLHEPSDDAPASLNFHTRADLTSAWELQWSQPLEGMTAADIDLRGLGFSAYLDTVYVGSYMTGATYRYIAQKPTDYTIAQVRPVDAQGVAEKAGEYVRLNGTVNTGNLSAAGYNFVMIENGAGVQVYNETKGVMTYTPTVGDNIEVIGTLEQNKGMLRLNVEYIKVESTGNAVTAPTVVTALTEANEALPVRIEQATLVDASQWTTGQGEDGFTVQVQKGTETINVYIPSSSALYNMAAPAGELQLDGIVFQSREEAPFTSGYYVVPQSAQDIKYATTVLADVQWCAGEEFNLPAYAMGANPAAATVRVELSDALGSFTTPQVIGTYQGTGAGQVAVTVPDVITGAGYRVRLVLEAPELTNLLSQSITITNAPDADFSQAGDVLTATEGDAYQWYKDGVAITGAEGTARTYTATQSGQYRVEVTTGGCSSMSDQKSVVVTAIRKDAEAQAVKLYPVPTTGELFLTMPGSVRKATRVVVTDLAGKTVLAAELHGSETLAMDLTKQAAGVYLVVLETPEGKIVRRVVKQ